MSVPAFITTVALIIALLFILIQIFLSRRPFFLWCMLTPLVLLAWFFISVTDRIQLPFDLTVNEACRHAFTQVSGFALLAAIVIYVVCRLSLYLQKKRRERRKAERLAAKRIQQARLAAQQAQGPEDVFDNSIYTTPPERK